MLIRIKLLTFVTLYMITKLLIIFYSLIIKIPSIFILQFFNDDTFFTHHIDEIIDEVKS